MAETVFTKVRVRSTLAVVGVLTAGVVAVTSFSASSITTTGTVTLSGQAGTSTGVILCLRSTGAIGKCAGGGTGSGTRVCSTCSSL